MWELSMQIRQYFRATVLVTALKSMIVLSCEHPVCRLGYEFCEPVKGVCRNCEDFKDFCFKDNKHISNCTSFCKDLVGLQDSTRNSCDQSQNITDDQYSIAVFVLAPALVIVIIGFLILLYKYLDLKRKNLESNTASTESERSTEFSSLETVSDPEKHFEELGYEVTHSLLGFKENNQQPNLKQISTTNDRPEKSELAVSGR